MDTQNYLENNIIPFNPRNIWKGKLYRQGEYIIKDYGDNPLIPKAYGRICIKLETTALKKLNGIDGIPSFHGRPTPYAIKLGVVPGTPIASLQRGALSEKFFDRLVSLFDQIHSRGVAHGDAHMRNILAHNDRPYLVDFSTAYIKGRIPLLEPRLFSWIALLDKERLFKVERFFFNRGNAPKMFFLYKMIKMFKEAK